MKEVHRFACSRVAKITHTGESFPYTRLVSVRLDDTGLYHTFTKTVWSDETPDDGRFTEELSDLSQGEYIQYLQDKLQAEGVVHAPEKYHAWLTCRPEVVPSSECAGHVVRCLPDDHYAFSNGWFATKCHNGWVLSNEDGDVVNRSPYRETLFKQYNLSLEQA